MADERAKDEFEKEKWTDELALRKEELELKRRESAKSAFSNPLVGAMVAATLALFSNVFVSCQNGRAALETERARNEGALILESIRTGDPAAAAKNLKFLVEAGLVRSDERLVRAIEGTEPGHGPFLPSATAARGGNVLVNEKGQVLTDDEGRVLVPPQSK